MSFHLKKYLVISAFLWGILFPNLSQAAFTVEKIRYWTAPDHTRVVFDATEEPEFRVEKRENEILIFLTKLEYAPSVKQVMKLAKPGVSAVSLESDHVRISLAEHREVKVFKLPPIENKPHRLVVDVFLPEGEKAALEAIPVKKRTIIIDPGHGGDDPGAIGLKGTQEKDVVLSVAKKIRDYINGTKNFQAVLTRDGDYYVPFRKRMRIARNHNAELFLSIHADSESSHLARGASVYVLSLRGASSEAARILARKENLADIIGGTQASETMLNGESESILLNMVQTNNMNKSRRFGHSLLRVIRTSHSVKFPRLQEAPFLVLKLPEVPSVLIELGYISHRREEKLLMNDKFQDRLARSIAEASIAFLTGRRSVKLAKAKESSRQEVAEPREVDSREVRKSKASAQDKVSYRVLKGETWVSIAERCGITVDELKAMNSSRRLMAGQLIKIPASGCLERNHIIYYRVKKGDTLDKIAIRHKIPVEKLRELNRNKKIKPLQYGEILLIPRN